MKRILYMAVMVSLLHAAEFKTVFQETIPLSAERKAVLTLKEENTEKLVELPAKIIVEYESNKSKKEYIFSDSSKEFPLLYFPEPTLHRETNERVDFAQGIHTLDLDHDGSNEICVYGTSHYGGSGLVGKVVVLDKNSKGKMESVALIEAKDNFEIQYIPKENIIVVAQYIWRAGVEGHYGDKHHYKLYIYEADNHYNKIPIMITAKKYDDSNSTVIKDTLDDVLKKYHRYKQQPLAAEDRIKCKRFVKQYWENIGKKAFENVKDAYASELEYYEKKLPKKKVLEELKRFYAKTRESRFELSDFLLYPKGKEIVVEYIRSFSEDNDTEYGTVHSLMMLQLVENSLLITKENDEILLEDGKDIE